MPKVILTDARVKVLRPRMSVTRDMSGLCTR